MFDTFMPEYSLDKFPELREFQSKTHSMLRDGFLEGHKRQLVSSPTGSGKTILALYLIAQSLMKGKRATFVCDRTALINQTSDVASSFGLTHGVIQAQHELRNNAYPFQIASVQTLAKRGWHDTDLIIVDEAHSQYKTISDYIPNFKGAVIGLSATPFSKGLGKLYSNLVNATTMHELTQAGVLVPMRVISATKINMQGALTSPGGEWAGSEVEKRGTEIIGNVVREWSEHAGNRKTIVFGATIAHCEDICRQFIDAGVMAAVCTSETPEDDCKQLFKDFKAGDIQVLISVEKLAKGFDVPDVGCVVDCRPLRKSLSTAIQMWGRGLRSSPDTGKTDCILLDHSGNIIRFLEDFTDIYFNGLESLDEGIKLDKKVREASEKEESNGCPKCSRKPFFKRCMACGFELVKPSLVEHVPGEMRVLTMPVMSGKKQLAESHASLWGQVCGYAAIHSAPEKQMGRAFHLYKDMTGMNPPKDYKFNPIEVSTQVANKIRSLNIRFNKSRRFA